MSETNVAGDPSLGRLEHSRGEVTLRFTRRMPHLPGKVWRALTAPEQLAAWFPTSVEGDLVPGAVLQFSFRDLTLPPFDGVVQACEPPKLLEFSWADERLRFELTPDGDGTLLCFSASFAEIGRAARDGAGWHTCLDLLGYGLAAERPPWPQDVRWRQVHRAYVDAFGAEAATIGPPAEWQDAYGPASGQPPS
jgi:uncharacterized protein YndB with AHSA1/START domain